MFPQINKSHYEQLRDKWTQRHKDLRGKLWSKHKDSLSLLIDQSKKFAIGSLTGLFLLTSPVFTKLDISPTIASQLEAPKIDKSVFLIADLRNILPHDVRPLTEKEEKEIADILLRTFKFKVTAELDGKRLNRSYGIIGAEQHLARFPDDTMATHFDTEEDARKFWQSGMAQGLGAWGYTGDSNREKYYIAVQTFLAPDFNKRFSEYRDFFKFRKMLVVNPSNGKAVVAVIGDSGPAEWTGKHLGGSPEIMNYLEREDGSKRGPVLYFFLDDPKDKIPLGPIGYN